MIDKEKVIAGLRELSDEGFQRRVWLASSGPEISSFSEAICQLFDDTGLDGALENTEHPTGFREEVNVSLRKLSQLVGRAAQTFRSLPPTAVIEHPQMRVIRSTAASILSQILGPENGIRQRAEKD